MGYEKEAYLYYLFHYTGKNDFQESTPNPNAYVQARPDVTFCAVGYHPPPPESQLALTCKGLVGTPRGMVF